MPSIYRTTIDLLLRAVANHAGEDGLPHSFLLSNNRNIPSWRSNLAATIFFSQRSMITTALFVRRHGPVYIRALSIDDIQTLLQDFLKENYCILAPETLFHPFSGNYAEYISDATKTLLAHALADSHIFSPTNKLTVFPLTTINVKHDFTSTNYFLCSPDGLDAQISPEYESQLSATVFPPIVNTKMRTETPRSWLGVHSPLLQTSSKIKTSILGAIALSLPQNDRYMFSGRSMFGGYCTFFRGVSFSFGNSHTPPIYRDIAIQQCDRPWLEILSKKMSSSNKEDRRHIRALEYFYRAWNLGSTERFPFLCMALDALYSETGSVAQSVIDGIHDTLDTTIQEKRLRMLMDLRASVIHGGAPDVTDSSKYRKYYQEFLSDPIDDLDDVLTESMRRRLFGNTFKLQTDNNTTAIVEMQKSGRLPRILTRRGILDRT